MRCVLDQEQSVWVTESNRLAVRLDDVDVDSRCEPTAQDMSWCGRGLGTDGGKLPLPLTKRYQAIMATVDLDCDPWQFAEVEAKFQEGILETL